MGETAEVLARAVQDHARRAGRIRADVAATRRARDRRRTPRRGDCSGDHREQEGHARSFTRDEHPFLGASWRSWPSCRRCFRQDRDHHRRQRLRDHRRRGRRGARQRAFVKQNNLKPLARIIGAASAGVDPRTMGIGPVPALHKLAGQVQVCDCTIRPDRTERSLRRAGARLRPRAALRPRAPQRQRRRHRARSPHRLHRHAHHGHAAARNAEAQHAKRGVATLCVSGGMGMALALENDRVIC